MHKTSHLTLLAALLLSVVLMPSRSFAAGTEASTMLIVPYFEVDLASDAGTTTRVALHNGGSDVFVASAMAYDRASNRLHSEVLTLRPHESRMLDLRDMADDLVADDDGVARGWLRVVGARATGGPVANNINQLWGDWFIIDDGGSTTQRGKLRPDADLCGTMELDLGDAGDDATLHLFATDPQGANSRPATARLSVYSRDGRLVESRRLYSDDTVNRLPLADAIESKSGTLRVEFVEGAGSASLGDTLYGRYVQVLGSCI